MLLGGQTVTVPRRIQRRRRRGWRMPESAVYVGRPTIWGNSFRITRSSDYHGLPGSWFLVGADGTMYHPDQDTQRSARQKAVELFAQQLLDPDRTPLTVARIRAELAGHDLVCWCPADEPCHADTLLQLANAPPAPTAAPNRSRPHDSTAGWSGRATELSCPRCGESRWSAERVLQHSEGDLSTKGRAQRLSCLVCGHEGTRV